VKQLFVSNYSILTTFRLFKLKARDMKAETSVDHRAEMKKLVFIFLAVSAAEVLAQNMRYDSEFPAFSKWKVSRFAIE